MPTADWFAHETATIDDGAEIGAGTKIWHYCHVSSGSRIGERCSIGQNGFVAPGVVIGTNVKIQNNVSLYDGVVVEDDVFLGPSCVLTNVINPRSHVSRRDQYLTTTLRRGCSVGANATIVCGHDVGRFAFIGAGAVVTKNVPAFAQVVGTPARIVAWRCQCGEKLPLAKDAVGERAHCASCGAHYTLLDATTLRWDDEATP